MMPIRAVVADDEPLVRERLRDLLRADAEIDVVAECGDGESALAAVRRHAPDLLLLDIRMPGLGGFEVLAALGPAVPPAVIFVTAYDRYAVKAFDARALDYVLKPIEEERFARALARAKECVRDRSGRGTTAEELLAALSAARSEAVRPLDRLAVKTGGRIVFVKSAEVDWIAAEGNYVRLHTRGGSHLVRESLGALEDRLDRALFLRIHRSTVVNVDSVVEIHTLFHGEYEVVLRDGTRLRMSRGYRAQLARFGGAWV